MYEILALMQNAPAERSDMINRVHAALAHLQQNIDAMTARDTSPINRGPRTRPSSRGNAGVRTPMGDKGSFLFRVQHSAANDYIINDIHKQRIPH